MTRPNCLFCGKQVEGHGSRKYCSKNCSNKAGYHRQKALRKELAKKKLIHKCAGCGATFEATRVGHEFCSKKCATSYRHLRVRGYYSRTLPPPQDGPMPVPEDWAIGANCTGMGDVSSPEGRGARHGEAATHFKTEVCGPCPVFDHCRTYVDWLEGNLPVSHCTSIWAGEDEYDRWRRRHNRQADGLCKNGHSLEKYGTKTAKDTRCLKCRREEYKKQNVEAKKTQHVA